MQCLPEPGTGSIIDKTHAERVDGAIPFQQAQGPTKQTHRPREFDPYCIRLFEDLYLLLLYLNGQENLADAVKAEICRHSVSWTKCRCTLRYFLEVFTVQDAEVLAFSHAEVQECIQKLCAADAWPFLQSPCRRNGHQMSQDISEWEAWCTDLAYQDDSPWSQLRPLPRSLSREKVILHAYAGRRRRGDIEWYIDSAAERFPGFMIFVASVDIVIDAVYGDISREETRSYWLSHIAAGHVIGFFAGPPCNTWSRARHHELGTSGGPRVVRTPTEPWGRSSLRLREPIQIQIGTLLLGFAFECIVALALHSGTGFVEHPKDPEQAHMVSIWKLPILRMILTLPNLRLVHLAQGLFGAPSAKPTTLLVLGMPTLEQTLHAHILTANLPSGVSVGRSKEGHFNTAPLKEYPPAMCKAIATAFTSAIVSTECDKTELPAELTARCKAMSGKHFGQHIGHDG